MTTEHATAKLLDAIEGVTLPAGLSGLATLAADVRRELDTDDTAETLLTAWLCTRRGGLTEMPHGDIQAAAEAARAMLTDLGTEQLRREADGEHCQPVHDANGNLVAVIRTGLLDDDGHNAVRHLVDAARARPGLGCTCTYNQACPNHTERGDHG